MRYLAMDWRWTGDDSAAESGRRPQYLDLVALADEDYLSSVAEAGHGASEALQRASERRQRIITSQYDPLASYLSGSDHDGRDTGPISPSMDDV